MSKIRFKHTKIETIVFRELRKRKIYFQKHCKLITGNPVIALPKKKIAVFIDGDFWHGYQFTKLKKDCRKNIGLKKIEDNIKRDRKNRAKLKREGWKVLRIWEHEIKKNFEKYVGEIIKFLKKYE